MPTTRKQIVFFVLGGFFLTNAILAELTGGKIIVMPAFGLFGFDKIPLSIGVLPWPVVFIITDLVNEYFGKNGVRKLTFLAVGMIAFTFGVLYVTLQVPTWERSPVTHEQFKAVFGQSMWIIVGSITAFLVSQLVDVVVFVAIKKRTGKRMLWLRATGSTAVSQLIDTFIVQFIGFVVPGNLLLNDFLQVCTGSYLYKLLIAVLITPIIYLAHGLIDRYLAGDETSSDEPPEARSTDRAIEGTVA